MKALAKKRATLTDLLNDLTFRVIYDKFKLLATSSFEWEGLEEIGIKPKHVENTLFDDGKAVFFRHPDMNFMCLPVSDTGKYNVYGEAISYTATGFGMKQFLDADECVIIENNKLRRNTHDFIMFYVNKITEAERTMDTNVKAVKQPYFITCDDKDVLTFKRIFQMVDGNTPAIFADTRMNVDAINVLKTDAKFLCNDLMDYKKSVENELLTFLGYDNLAVDKKERVNLSEANSNNQITESFADLQLKAREDACERINEMFGLNISVKRREVKNDVGTSTLQHNEIDT